MSDRIEGDPPVRSAEAVAADLPADATLAVSGFSSVGYPKAVPLALAERGRDLSLTVISGGTLGAEIDVTLAEAEALARRYPFTAKAPTRDRVNDGRIAFADRHVRGMGDDVRFGRLPAPDVALVEAVAVGPDWFVPSTCIGHTPAYVAAADRLVVEVNHAQPRALERLHDVVLRGIPPARGPLTLDGPGARIGSPRIEFPRSKLAAVVETDRPDSPYEFRDPTPADRAIADNLGGFLERELAVNPILAEAVHLEFGVGSLGNALMGRLGSVEWGERSVAYFGEVFQDGLLDVLDEGLLSAASATALALSREGQERLFSDIERYAEDVVLRPADVSNDPGLIDRFGVIAVNGALEVDLYGNVNSTHIGGTHLVGGIGGSGDFNRNAALSVAALASTAGDTPRVVPMATHVDHTEHDVDIVVTEQGVADLRGLAPRERTERLIALAHPDHRPALESYLERAVRGGGHIPHDLETAFDWQ